VYAFDEKTPELIQSDVLDLNSFSQLSLVPFSSDFGFLIETLLTIGFFFLGTLKQF